MFLLINGERINVNSIIKYNIRDKNKYSIKFFYDKTMYIEKIFPTKEDRDNYLIKLDQNLLLDI
jgi:hypothetical protein